MSAMHWTKSGDYYVDGIKGDDSNAGTAVAPYKTISAAVSAAEAGGSGIQTIVVGPGTYNERIVAGSTSDYLVLQADGQVILDGSGISDSMFYEGYKWEIRNFIINLQSLPLLHGSNDARSPAFFDCFIHNGEWYKGGLSWIDATYMPTFHRCIFRNMASTSQVSSSYVRYWMYLNCMFINSNAAGYSNTGVYSGNSYPPNYRNCVIDNPGKARVAWYRNTTAGGNMDSCMISQNSVIRDNDLGYVSGSMIATLPEDSGYPWRYVNVRMASMSFATQLSGSDTATPAQFAMAHSIANADYFSNETVVGKFSGVNQVATSYGHDAASSNPLHINGGATWDNITSSLAGGFQISASAHPTGTITSAVIDQGSVKPIREIQLGFAASVPNAVGISVHTASIDNQYPTRQTFEMRKGNASDLSSESYQIYEFGNPLYIDTNGSGSGDQNFTTGSGFNGNPGFTHPTARYIQLRLTLRSDISGSA